MTSPTPEQLARAAELAPRVADAIPKAAFQGSDGLWFYQDNEAADLLSAHAFQQVLLALPEELYIAAIDLVTRQCDMGSRAFFRWLLTPAGMLAFYEALVALEGEA